MSLLNPKSQAGKVSNHPRQTSSSGVYNTFTTKQIQGFKEAFNMLDQDGDGLISRNDLARMLENLGQTPSNKFLDSYAITGNGINFTQFLTMFGEHLTELDEERVLLDAFECFDERDEGKIEVGELRYWLGEVGDRMTAQEIDRLLSGPFTDRSGRNFDYKAFIEAVKGSEPAELG